MSIDEIASEALRLPPIRGLFWLHRFGRVWKIHIRPQALSTMLTPLVWRQSVIGKSKQGK